MASLTRKLTTKPAASCGTPAEQTEWTKLVGKLTHGPERTVALSVTFTPVGVDSEDTQLAIVKPGVLWLKSSGYAQWAQDKDMVPVAGSNFSCEVGDNGWAGYQGILLVKTTIASQPISQSDLNAAKALKNVKARVTALQKLRNNSEFDVRMAIGSFLKSSRGLP